MRYLNSRSLLMATLFAVAVAVLTVSLFVITFAFIVPLVAHLAVSNDAGTLRYATETTEAAFGGLGWVVDAQTWAFPAAFASGLLSVWVWLKEFRGATAHSDGAANIFEA